MKSTIAAFSCRQKIVPAALLALAMVLSVEAQSAQETGKETKAMSKQGVTMKYDKIHKVLGEGNFVLTVSEGKLGGKHSSFYDLFRVEKGKIAEHWDTIEVIPEKNDWKNGNGKF